MKTANNNTNNAYYTNRPNHNSHNLNLNQKHNKQDVRRKKQQQQQIQKVNNNHTSHIIPIKQKSQRHISINMPPKLYTSLHVKHLGNHSMFKRTTSQTRYNDNRLQLINPNYFINKHVLDIGCNEGFLDIEIAMRFFPKQIYAIDIDTKLIKNAKKTLYSIIKKDVNYQRMIDKAQMQEKEKLQIQQEENEINQDLSVTQRMKQLSFQNHNQKISEKFIYQEFNQQQNNPSFQQNQKIQQKQRENQENVQICKKIKDLPLFFQDRLKKQFSIDHFLPSNVRVFAEEMFKPQNRFPLNIKFEADNIYTIKYQEDKLYYDTILCLKVTKWIHLTFGDDGIRRLFQKIYDLLRLDGILILQAQDWASYKRKKNMNQIYSENYERILTGPNEFESMLINDPLKDFKFELIQKIDQNQRRDKGSKKLDYPILIFKKKSTMLYY